MKKLVFGAMAVALAFSVTAQTTEGNDKKNEQRKEFRHRQFKDETNFDKLNLTDEQKTQIKTIDQNFKQQMKYLHKQGNLTVDEQKQKRQELANEHREKIVAVLTLEQRNRAETLRKDFRGDRDGARGRFDELTKDLNLTQEQSAKLESINSTFKTNLHNVRQNNTLSDDQKKEQMRSLMKQHRSAVEALLTNDQKEQLKNRLKNRPNRTSVR